MSETRSTSESMDILAQAMAEMAQAMAEMSNQLVQAQSDYRATFTGMLEQLRGEMQELKLSQAKADFQNDAEEKSSFEHHEIVSSSTEPKLISEDEMKTASIVDGDDSVGVDFDLDIYSDLVLAKLPDVVEEETNFSHLISDSSSESEVVEWKETQGFAKSVYAPSCYISKCSPTVCENASVYLPSFSLAHETFNVNWCSIQLFYMAVVCPNPPWEPPDSFLNALEVLKESGVANISFMILIWLCKFDEVSCRILIRKHQTEFIWIIYVQVLLNQEMVFYDTYGNNGDILNHLLSSVLLLQYTLGDTVDSCCLIMAMPFSGMVSGFSNCWTITLTTLWARSFIVFYGGVSNIFFDNLTEKIQDAYVEVESSIIPEQCLLRWKFLLMFGDLNCKEHLIVGQTRVGSYFAHLVVEKVIGTTKYNEDDSYFYVNLHPVDNQAVWVFNMDKSEVLHEEKWFKSPSCARSRKFKFCISDACDSAYQTSFSFSDMLWDLVIHPSTLRLCKDGLILLVWVEKPPPLPPDIVRYLIKYRGVLIEFGDKIHRCLGRMDFAIIWRYSIHPMRTEMKLWPFKMLLILGEKLVIVISCKGGTEKFSDAKNSFIVLFHQYKFGDAYLGTTIEIVDVTFSTYFNESQLQAIKDASIIARLNVLHIIKEPIDIISAYDLANKATSVWEKIVLIFDPGGMTFDVHILSIVAGSWNVLTLQGNFDLVGNNFPVFSNHSHATQDLYDSIAAGNYPEWKLFVQTIDPDHEDKFDFDPLDVTKTWPEDILPLQLVGRMVLNKNIDNCFAENEQLAFYLGKFKEQLTKEFEMNDLGKLSYYLGIEVKQSAERITLKQSSYEWRWQMMSLRVNREVSGGNHPPHSDFNVAVGMARDGAAVTHHGVELELVVSSENNLCGAFSAGNGDHIETANGYGKMFSAICPTSITRARSMQPFPRFSMGIFVCIEVVQFFHLRSYVATPEPPTEAHDSVTFAKHKLCYSYELLYAIMIHALGRNEKLYEALLSSPRPTLTPLTYNAWIGAVQGMIMSVESPSAFIEDKTIYQKNKFVNHISMYSLPRPPEFANLEDKVVLKEAGMLHIQISISLGT